MEAWRSRLSQIRRRQLPGFVFALGLTAAIGGSAVPLRAAPTCSGSIAATNQIIRVEGHSELVGDIVLVCTGPSAATTPGTLVPTADITITIPSTRITSKIINGGDPHSSGTPISEATLIMDDLKDQTTSVYPGSRPHLVCNDNTNPGGWGVCQIYAKATGPQDTYDGSSRPSGPDCPIATCTNPNIFVGRPSGDGAIVFKGVPLDSPGANFTRYIRITNIRVDAAATGLQPGNPLSQITAIVSFQGSASLSPSSVQTTVATIQTGNGGAQVVADSSFLQCSYPTATLAVADKNVSLAETHGWTSACGTASACAGLSHSQITVDTASTYLGNHPVIKLTEGFQSAWKARNMSEYLGGNGIVLPGVVSANCPTLGSPCLNGSTDANAASSAQYFTYSTGLPANNPADIAQNNPEIRFFAEGGFTETAATVIYTTPTTSSFSYAAGATGPGAGTTDFGTRLQFALNLPAGVVASLPTVVVLHNGGLVSGVMALTNVTGAGTGPFNRVAPSSALPSLAAVQMQEQFSPLTPLTLTAGYVDFSASSQTITYEVLMADPFSDETATIYPIISYPSASLPGSLVNGRPQPDVWATVSNFNFVPNYPSTGDQVTSPLGQTDGTPRFAPVSTSPIDLFTIGDCAVSITSVAPGTKPVFSPSTSITINGSGFTAQSSIVFTPPGGSPLTIVPSSIQASRISATLPSAAFTKAGGAQIKVLNGLTGSSNLLPFTITQVTPVISWSNPAAITAGTALGSTQLNATANVPGAFVYTPPAGTVLPAGNGQKLSVQFTPTDAVNYASVSASVLINVNPAQQPPPPPPHLVLTYSLSSSRNTVTAVVKIANTGGSAAKNVRLTAARIGSTRTTTDLPYSFGSIAARDSETGAFRFVDPGKPGSKTTITVSGTYTGGTFASTTEIRLPGGEEDHNGGGRGGHR